MKKNPFNLDFSEERKNNLLKPLDWEESAIDSLSLVEGFSERTVNYNFFYLTLALGLIFLVIVFRLFYLQILNGHYYNNFADQNRLRQQVILAPRGIIKDRYANILAKNTASFNLVAVPFDLPKSDLVGYLNELSKIVKFDVTTAQNKIRTAGPNSLDPLLIAQNISEQESILFDTQSSHFVGFSLQKIPVREYDFPEAYFHLLGYAGFINAQEFKNLKPEGYNSLDFIGKSGIEQNYEKYLKGENGYSQIEVDARGNLLAKLGTKEPQGGYTLNLNIDKALQEEIYKVVKRILPKGKVAVVAMKPATGEVFSLLSLPGLDGSRFAKGLTQEEYQTILTDKKLPLFNRVIQGTYPPSSTVKPMVALMALEEGVITEQTEYKDNGVLVIPNQYNSNINYNFYGWKRDGLGVVDVKLAIAKSSDIFFYIVAGGYPKTNLPGLGIDKLSAYYRKFGLGEITGIDLPGEKAGLVPDVKWKAEYFKSDPILSKWYLGDTYHVGIGQGDLLTTPLQVLLWTATIANRGVGMQPQVLKSIIDEERNKVIFEQSPKVKISKFVDYKNIKIVQEGMRETVLSGSGRLLNTLSISSAGKTGTSQFDGSDPKKTHAWFTAYAPYEDPQIAITVLVEAGGEGSSVSVPIVKEVLDWWSKNRYNR
jgi:penicillin-binding protein 2